MPGIPFRVVGRVFSDGERSALLFSPDGLDYSMRLGFVLRGTEETFLPESLLDDWGHEIGGAAIYHWVKENASDFPRAELFGFDLGGRSQQCFIREVDLTAKYACYVYESSEATLEDGIRLTAILLADEGTDQQRKIKTPVNVSFPLSEADVQWWLVDEALAGQPDYDFYRSQESDETG